MAMHARIKSNFVHQSMKQRKDWRSQFPGLASRPFAGIVERTMKRAFISFDYDNDSDLKVMLVGQPLTKSWPSTIANP